MATRESKLLLSVVLTIISFTVMVTVLHYSFNGIEIDQQNNMQGYYVVTGFIITIILIVSLVWYLDNHLQ